MSFIRFYSRVIDIAEKKFSASCSGPGAEEFVNRLFLEYGEAGSPAVDPWLKKRLESEYLYVLEPPKWVESEPSWLFFDERPMVFISQTELPKTPITETRLTWDSVIYLFGSRVTHDDGYTVEYRTVTQSADIHGTGL